MLNEDNGLEQFLQFTKDPERRSMIKTTLTNSNLPENTKDALQILVMADDPEFESLANASLLIYRSYLKQEKNIKDVKESGNALLKFMTEKYPKGYKLLSDYMHTHYKPATIAMSTVGVNADVVANVEAVANAAVWANAGVATNVVVAAEAIVVVAVFVI